MDELLKMQVKPLGKRWACQEVTSYGGVASTVYFDTEHEAQQWRRIRELTKGGLPEELAKVRARREYPSPTKGA